MSDKTAIEWTDATWNPVTGCTEVSPGCDHCYAKTFAERWRGTPGHYFEHGFDVQLRPDKLDQPLRWKKPRRIFVNSMSDLFHDQVPDDYIAQVFAVMSAAPQHTFQVLTKRHGRMRSLLRLRPFQDQVQRAVLQRAGDKAPWLIEPWWPLRNCWLGVSVEDQHWADIRIPALQETPAAVRFLSCEPLLGPINLVGRRPDLIDWLIVGGESGRGARPMHPDWARSLRDQCTSAGVPFLFKQWGEWAPTGARGAGIVRPDRMYVPDSESCTDCIEHQCGAEIQRVGKKAAGRELDGRTWDEYPERAA